MGDFFCAKNLEVPQIIRKKIVPIEHQSTN